MESPRLGGAERSRCQGEEGRLMCSDYIEEIAILRLWRPYYHSKMNSSSSAHAHHLMCAPTYTIKTHALTATHHISHTDTSLTSPPLPSSHLPTGASAQSRVERRTQTKIHKKRYSRVQDTQRNEASTCRRFLRCVRN